MQAQAKRPAAAPHGKTAAARWGVLRALRHGIAGGPPPPDLPAKESSIFGRGPPSWHPRSTYRSRSRASAAAEAAPWEDPDEARTDEKSTLARRPLVSFVLGTGLGQALALLLLAAAVVVSCAGLWLVGGWPSAGGGWGAAGSLSDALWTSYTFFVDPGKHASMLPGDPAEKLGIGVLTSFLGLLWVMVVFGLVVDGMRLSLEAWRRRHARTVLNRHVVVLGWTDKTLFLLGELAQMLTDGRSRGGSIVVLGSIDEHEFREELDVTYPHRKQRWGSVRFHYRQGKPHEVDDLERVSIFSARHVVVLGGSRKPREADSLALSAVCALRCLPDGKSLNASTSAVVELRLPQNVSVARQLGGPRVEPVTAGSSIDELLALMTLGGAAGPALLSLMTFVGAQLEIVSAEPFVAEAAGLRALPPTFGEMRGRFGRAVLLGVRSAEHVAMLLAPADARPIAPTDALVVVADSFAGANAVDPHPLAPRAGVPYLGRMNSRLGRLGGKQRASAAALSAASHAPPAEPPRAASLARGDSAASDLSAGLGVASAEPVVLLLVGWAPGLFSLLHALDRRLPPQSEVVILSEKGLAWRREELAAEGLGLDGARLEPTPDGSAPRAAASGHTPKRRMRRASLARRTLGHVRLSHEVGFATDESALRRLPLERASAAIVCADVDEFDVDTQVTDSEAMTSALLLRNLLEGREATEADSCGALAADADAAAGAAGGGAADGEGGAADKGGLAEASHAFAQPRFTLVVELQDVLSRRLLARQPALLTDGLDPRSGIELRAFHRNFLETAALSISAHSRTSWSAVMALLDAHGGADLHAIGAAELLERAELAPASGRPPGQGTDAMPAAAPTFSFLDLAERARVRSGALLLGWRRADGGGRAVLNPARKRAPLSWAADDELLVVRAHRPAKHRAPEHVAAQV